MELHVVLPSESSAMPAGELAELSILAEELGYGGVWLPEHVLLPSDEGEELGGVFEPLVALAYIAGATATIKVGTSVLVAPLRNPFVLARQVTTLASLCGERFQLGLGVGWNETEFREVGSDFGRRGRATDEAIRLIRHITEDGKGPYQDGQVRFSEAVFAPRIGGHVPIHIGGVSKAAYRRAARLGDGWQGMEPDPNAFAASVSAIRSLTDRPIVMGTRARWSRTSDPLAEMVTHVEGLRAVGADYLAIHFGDWERYSERMRELSAAVGLA